MLDRGLKRAMALAQQNGNRATRPAREKTRTVGVGNGQVQFAIPVEIAYGHGRWLSARGIVNRSLEEGAITPPQQNGNGIVRVVDGQIRLAIPVEIACCHRGWI